MAGGEPREPAQSESGESSTSPEASGDLSDRHAGASEIGDVSFPVSVRGYDRGAVDAYVSRVEQLVAELEVTRSPEAAVKQALEQVGEQTKRLLEEAGVTAGQITVTARQEAEDSTARANQEAESVVAAAKAEAAEIAARSDAAAEATVAKARKEAAEHLESARAEAAAVREEAEARLRELQADTETIRHERSRLLGDLHELATRVEGVASAAHQRFPSGEAPDQAEEGKLQAEAADDETATDGPTAEAATRQRSSA